MEYFYLIARNVANQDRLDAVIQSLQKLTKKQNIQTWLKKTFRLYLLNDYENVKKAKPNVKYHEKVNEAISRGDEVFELMFSKKDIDEFKDIVTFLDNKHSEKDVLKYNVQDLMKIKGKEDSKTEGYEIYTKLENGKYLLGELTTQDSFLDEGKEGSWCIKENGGDTKYFDNYKNGTHLYLSIRKKSNNKPIALLEIDKNKKKILQLKLKSNGKLYEGSDEKSIIIEVLVYLMKKKLVLNIDDEDLSAINEYTDELENLLKMSRLKIENTLGMSFKKLIPGIDLMKVSTRVRERSMYYWKNPDDADAKQDEDYDIRLAYYGRHSEDPDAKKDTYPEIRIQYYTNHPEDTDAKKDKDSDVKYTYYENNPDDLDAKNEEDKDIRILYYRTHPEDKDYEKDTEISMYF